MTDADLEDEISQLSFEEQKQLLYSELKKLVMKANVAKVIVILKKHNEEL